jgi:HEAT repeat protein
MVCAFAMTVVLAWPGNWGRLVGLLRGESFWRGYPSSYWRAEMQEWIKQWKTGPPPPSPIEQWVLRLRLPFSLSRDRRRELAPIWLMEDDPASVPVLRELARDADTEVSAHAVTALRVLREDGRSGLPELRAALHHPSPTTRLIAAEGVWDLTHEADDLAPLLVALLDNRDHDVRWRAAANLKRIGPAAEIAVPPVLQTLETIKRRSREGTLDEVILLRSLVALGPEGQRPALPEVLKLLERALQAVQVRSLDSAAPTDWNALHHGEWAIKILVEIGPSATEAIPLLTEAMKVPYWCPHAARALHRIDPQNEDPRILDALVRIVQVNASYESAPAAEVLGEMGDTAKFALPHLLKLLNAKDSNFVFGTATGTSSLHFTVAKAIWRIDHRAVVVLPTILEEFRNPPWHTHQAYARQPLVELLQEIGPPAKAAVPDLMTDLVDARPQPGYEALTRWEDRENARQMKRDYAKYRAAVTQALGAIGPEAKSAIPALLAALQDESPSVRTAVAEALHNIDPTLSFGLPSVQSSGEAWWSRPAYAATTAILVMAFVVWWVRRKRRQMRLPTTASTRVISLS